jgi:pimeloyl-ACP methyl ester carboxylesterase
MMPGVAVVLLGTLAAVALPKTTHAAGAVRSADGVPIAYTVQGRGTPAVVLVHCWACDHTFWDGQVPHLARRHRVVTVDLGGHGRSGGGRADWTIAAFAEDVAAVVRHLDLKEVVLVGHSMGGPVVVETAHRLPGRVVGLVPVDTLLDVDQVMTAEQIDAALKGFSADFPGATGRFMREWMFVPASRPALVTEIVQKAQAIDPTVGLSAIRNTWAYDPRPRLRELRVPIVAVNADRFPTNLAAARRYAPQFDAIIVKGWGHYLMREDPGAFNRALDEALRRIARP